MKFLLKFLVSLDGGCLISYYLVLLAVFWAMYIKLACRDVVYSGNHIIWTCYIMYIFLWIFDCQLNIVDTWPG